jgi:transcriptional antiterminator Rof (Rho-off)
MEKEEAAATVDNYVPIPCGDYEMLEIACMDGYEVEVHTDGRTIVGRADTLNVRSGEEFFVVRLTGGVHDTIRVDRIRCLVVRTRPARFSTHKFTRSVESPIR